ncbi:unnamed protein product, partial [Phaeothamnion confervicola]
DSTSSRILHFYLPVYFWMSNLVAQRLPSSGPMIVGISAPQGCGKSTLAAILERLFAHAGKTCAVLSLDDFYLRGCDQDALARANMDNPLLQVRGNAGTHDLSLGLDTLRRLRRLAAGETAPLPRYDKAARGGRGDRLPEAAWPAVAAPPAVVLLEGWMLGFRPLATGDPALTEQEEASAANAGEPAGTGGAVTTAALRGYLELHNEMDSWIVIE